MNSNSFNQAYYQNIPNSEVNWAELAQKWIMTRAPAPPISIASGPVNRPNFIIPSLPPPPVRMGQPPPLMPPQLRRFPPPFPIPNMTPIPPPLDSSSAGFFPNYWNSTDAPPPPLIMPPGCFPPTNALQQNSDNEEYKAHYDASLEQDEEQNEGDTLTGRDAPAGAMSHWFSGLDDPTVAAATPPDWMWGGPSVSSVQGGLPFPPLIDTHMRKKLPAWILEGLEKAEKEKQKKLEADMRNKQRENLEKKREAKRVAKGLGKFDSDSGSEEHDDEEEEEHQSKNDAKDSEIVVAIEKKADTFHDSNLDEDVAEEDTELSFEEREQEALLAMRKLTTLVLLEATSAELQRISKECLARAKREARPKLLASSDALTALSALGADDDEDTEDIEHASRSKSDENNKRDYSSQSVKKADKNGLNCTVEKPRLQKNLAELLRPPVPSEETLPKATRSSEKDSRSTSKSSRHHDSLFSLKRSHAESSSTSLDKRSSRDHRSASDSKRRSDSSSSNSKKSTRRSRDRSPTSTYSGNSKRRR